MHNHFLKGLEHWFIKRTEHPGVQFFRYNLSGFFSFLMDWALLETLVYIFSSSPWKMKMVSFIFGSLVSYYLSSHWVFPKKRTFQKLFQVGFYVIGTVVGLALGSSAIWLLTEKFSIMPFRISNLLGMGLVWIWNFFSRKFLIFRTHKPVKEVLDSEF